MALKALWRLGTLFDGGGLNLTLSAANGPTIGQNRFGVNGAYVYNGSATAPQYHFRSAATALNVVTDFTLSAAIFPTALQSTTFFGLQNGIMAKGPASFFNWGMQLTSATELAFIKRTGAESIIFYRFTGLSNLMNKWTVVTMVVTGGFVKLYLDGVYQSQLAVGTIGPAANDTVFVGSMSGGTGTSVTSFAGSMHDVRVYDHALSDPEILAIFQQGEHGLVGFLA